MLYLKNVNKIKNFIWPKTLSKNNLIYSFFPDVYLFLCSAFGHWVKIAEICPPVCQQCHMDDKTEKTITREHTRASSLFLLLKPCVTFAKEYRTWSLGINHRRICNVGPKVCLYFISYVANYFSLTVLAESFPYDLSFCLEGAQICKSFLLLIDKI